MADLSPGEIGRWCARLTGQEQEVKVLCGKGNNQTMPLPEPCDRSREGTGEASAGAHVGRAIERRNLHSSECRGRHLSRRQHCSDRFGKVREGSAASKNPRTHVRSRSEAGRPLRFHVVDAKAKAMSQAKDARRRGVGPRHSSDEVGKQSTGCRVAESVERRPWRNGRREGKAMLRTQSREAPRWARCWTGTERHGSSRGVPSQPERGAGCVSAHVRIWAGPVG